MYSNDDNEGTRTVGHTVRFMQVMVQVETSLNFLLE